MPTTDFAMAIGILSIIMCQPNGRKWFRKFFSEHWLLICPISLQLKHRPSFLNWFFSLWDINFLGFDSVWGLEEFDLDDSLFCLSVAEWNRFFFLKSFNRDLTDLSGFCSTTVALEANCSRSVGISPHLYSWLRTSSRNIEKKIRLQMGISGEGLLSMLNSALRSSNSLRNSRAVCDCCCFSRKNRTDVVQGRYLRSSRRSSRHCWKPCHEVVAEIGGPWLHAIPCSSSSKAAV